MNSEPISHEEALAKIERLGAEIDRLNRRVSELKKESEDRYRAWDYQHKQADQYSRVAEASENRFDTLAAQVRKLGIVSDVQINGKEISFGASYDAMQMAQMVQICVATLNQLVLERSGLRDEGSIT